MFLHSPRLKVTCKNHKILSCGFPGKHLQRDKEREIERERERERDGQAETINRTSHK